MSEQKDHPYTDDELRDALAFVAEKTPNAPCPACAHTLWTFENDETKARTVPRVTFIPFTNRAFFGPAPAIPTIPLTCENCGFVRQHNLPMVMSLMKTGSPR